MSHAADVFHPGVYLAALEGVVTAQGSRAASRIDLFGHPPAIPHAVGLVDDAPHRTSPLPGLCVGPMHDLHVIIVLLSPARQKQKGISAPPTPPVEQQRVFRYFVRSFMPCRLRAGLNT